jgi:NADH-quinone oxidoreductase subunit A
VKSAIIGLWVVAFEAVPPCLYSSQSARLAGRGASLSEYFDQYLTVLAFGAFGAVLVALLLGLASLIRPSNSTPAKLETYESGIDPIGGGYSQTHIRYYVFALLFLIFDVEAVFIFPWALKIESLGAFALWEMFIFIAILLMGLIYAVRKGVLKWE